MNIIGTRACRVPNRQGNPFWFKYIGGTVNIRPLHDRVVLKREPEERKTPDRVLFGKY